MTYHEPVLLRQSVDLLKIQPEGIYVDVTFGGGGHSKEIVKKLNSGKLFGFDQDPDAHLNTLSNQNFILIKSNFRHLKNNLRLHDIHRVNGLLADLGVSSHQVDEGSRGFSIRFEGPLDMRMNPDCELSAREVVNHCSSKELIRIFREYGEIKNARVLVNQIIRIRKKQSVETTTQLKQSLQHLEPRNKQKQFWARLFQAIRIEVNQELEALKEMLQQAAEMLSSGGRLVVISYHSLEDRLVKNFLKVGNFTGEPKKDFYGNLIRPFKPITRKPMIPDETEINKNPRASSAKLRAAEKIN